MQAIWNSYLQAAAFKVCKYIQSTSGRLTGCQSRAIWRCPQGGSHKNWGSRWVSKLLSRKCQQGVARRREQVKTASSCLGPREHLSRPLCVWQIWGHPSGSRGSRQASFIGSQSSVSVHSLCSALGVLACQEQSLWLLQGPEDSKAVNPHHYLQSQAIQKHLLGGSLKTRPPVTCEASLWEILAFWFVQGEHEVSISPWRALERIVISTYTWV